MRIKDIISTKEKVTEKYLRQVLVTSICSILLCMCCFVSSTWAWYNASISNQGITIQVGEFDADVVVYVKNTQNAVNPVSENRYQLPVGTYTVSIMGNVENTIPGYCVVKLGEQEHRTIAIYPVATADVPETVTFDIVVEKMQREDGSSSNQEGMIQIAMLEIIPTWGRSDNGEGMLGSGSAETLSCVTGAYVPVTGIPDDPEKEDETANPEEHPENPETAEPEENPKNPETAEPEENPENPETVDPEENPETPEAVDPEENPETPETVDPEENPESPETAEPEENPENPETAEPEENPENPETVNPEENPESPETVDPEENPESPEVTEDDDSTAETNTPNEENTVS